MTHLYIELNTGLTEEVNSSIISKLYELAISGDLDASSDLKGRLHTTLGYRSEIEYLNTNYQDLYISADDYAIPFEDPNMLSYLLNLGIGSNGYITEALAAAATSVANSTNTTVTKFNEFKYFTSITESAGGFSSSADGNFKFYDWDALEEIDISNLTSIGHDNSNGWGDTLVGCDSLKKVTASNKLKKLGYYAFGQCSNLEEITGLSGVIETWDRAFVDCSKLKLSFFQPLLFLLKTFGRGEHFSNCTLLTSITIADGTTSIPKNCFYGCTNLSSVSIPSTVTTVGNAAFQWCTSLTNVDIDWTKITSVEDLAFNNCTSLLIGQLSVPNITSLGQFAFYNTKVLTVTNLGSITTLQPQVFRGCSSLTSVTLPATITEIRNHAFCNCTNLTTINIPSTCTSIYNNAFETCSNLDVTLDLSNVTDIGAQAFKDCTKLKISNLPKASSYSSQSFLAAKGLTNVVIPKEVVTIGSSCFNQCTNIQTVTFELNSQLDYIKDNAFNSCSSLLTLIIPEGCTKIGDGAFASSGIILLDIPSTVTEIGSVAFRNLPLAATIIFRCDVPTFGSTSDIFAYSSYDLQLSTVTIYVPDDLVAAYKAVPCLSNVIDHIYGISQMPNS